MKKKLGKRQDKVRSDREENRKRLENEPTKREYYGKNAAKSYLDTAKMKIKDNKLAKEEARIMEEAKKISARIDPDNITDSVNNKKRKHSDWVIHERDRKAKEAFMKEFGGKKPRNAKLHERINKRGEAFKSQNESIAILLTEAALLLNESVGVKEKATDKVVKVFNTNKEAADWIANNGGNDMYQLTNRLK